MGKKFTEEVYARGDIQPCILVHPCNSSTWRDKPEEA
jgi:hypothetical protein